MGGASNRAWNAALGLKGLGHRIKVIAGFPHYPDGNISARYRRKAVVKEHVNGLEEILSKYKISGSKVSGKVKSVEEVIE